MIELVKVNKYFNKHKKNQIHVINNTTLKFDKNGLVALLGPSGSGKTTLLNVIGGLDNVSGGKIFIDDKRITKRRVKKIDEIRNLNVGYIFQDYKLVENMTVFENVALSLKIIGIKDKKEIENRVLYTLEKVNMLRYKNRSASMLSGGERQRVGIARALVKNPKIIIADEPTGNLDSKNSIEIMNIIKNISQKYLVVLVTHEERLAKFYADRIIKLEDGKVIDDYDNVYNGSLDLKLDNEFYLKDFKNSLNIKKDNLNINVYRDNNEDLNITMVFKNGNIYIKTQNKEKLEIVENNSNIKFINDNYKELKEVKIKKDVFDIASVLNNKYKEKYSSIFNLKTFITQGFKKILDYPILKKILLGGFFLSGMFVFYSVSSIFATLNIEDKDFVTMNKDYLRANINSISVEDYLEIENNANIYYILPSNSIINFEIYFTKLMQTEHYSAPLSGSLSDIKMISEQDLILGRLPKEGYEIVVDKIVLDNLIKNSNTNFFGYYTYEDYLDENVFLNNLNEFTIVGITDVGVPNIYANQSMFINMLNGSINLNNSIDLDYYDTNKTLNLLDYEIFIDEAVKLVSGTIPKNAYEVLVNIELKSSMPLNKTIDAQVNGKNLKVVGYYENNVGYEVEGYLVNNDTIKYNLLENTNTLTIYSMDKDNTIEYLHNFNINAGDSYQYAKEIYINEEYDSIISSLTTAGVMLGISLIEILLMIRSSFMTRIKEVGVYRAIGVKKSDIYKMFSGEILAITITSSLTGIAFMSYILYYLGQISYISDLYMVNIFTFFTSVLIVLLFNIIVGLFPVYNTIRKTPAQILARCDVE